MGQGCLFFFFFGVCEALGMPSLLPAPRSPTPTCSRCSSLTSTLLLLLLPLLLLLSRFSRVRLCATP